jgi:hypothetical protein
MISDGRPSFVSVRSVGTQITELPLLMAATCAPYLTGAYMINNARDELVCVEEVCE